MTARLASGKEINPNLIRTPNNDLDQPKALSITAGTLDAIRKGMFDVLNEKEGTAFKYRSIDENFSMAGKTGTSQVRKITREERERGVIKNEDLPWKMRDHALFTCFAPYKYPRYALSVVVEHGGSGSKVAAPIARDIMLFQLYGGIPPITAYPDKQQSEVQSRLLDIAGKINLKTNINPNI